MKGTDVLNIEFSPEKLLDAMREANVTQAQLSEMSGFPHRNTINKIVKRKRAATATELLRLSFALNKNPQDFAKA